MRVNIFQIRFGSSKCDFSIRGSSRRSFKVGETTTDGERADLVLGATTGFFWCRKLDVAYNWDGWIMSIYGISENLYRLDENIEPQPWIAESVETPDENTWVFTIRDGVTFSNGKR